MATQADVRSLAELDRFRDSMQHFRMQLLREIESAEAELRRLSQWLEEDVTSYWADQLARAQRRFTDTQATLSRCMSYVRSDERRPCTEEKKRFAKAKHRREFCEAKLKLTKSAVAHWEREKAKNQASMERCRDMADSEILVALNQISAQIDRLQQYATLRSPASRNSTASPSQSEAASAGGEVQLDARGHENASQDGFPHDSSAVKSGEPPGEDIDR